MSTMQVIFLAQMELILIGGFLGVMGVGIIIMSLIQEIIL
jgi:hypothetical protein